LWSRLAWAKMRPYLQNNKRKKGLEVRFMHEVLSSNPSTSRKRKEETNENKRRNRSFFN
jgi:hypothetical protein